MKKLITFFISFCFILSLTGCDDSVENKSTSNDTSLTVSGTLSTDESTTEATSSTEPATSAISEDAYKDAILDYFDVHRNGQMDKFDSLAPKEVIDTLTEKKGFDLESRREYFGEYAEALIESCKEIYGEDMVFTVTVGNKEPETAGSFEYMQTMMAGIYGIPKEDVKELAIAEFNATFTGNGKEKSGDGTIMIVLIRDKWYVCDGYANFGITHNDLNIYH